MGWRLNQAMGERMRCADCQWKYPDAFLNQMRINESYTEPICGICALERANQLSGVTREAFKSQGAETARQSAIKWRKNHPADAPQVN